MTHPLTEAVQAALATVNDPEIRRPITDLGMVDSIEIDQAGAAKIRVLLTVAGLYPCASLRPRSASICPGCHGCAGDYRG